MFLIQTTEKALKKICFGDYPNWLGIAKKQTKIVISISNSDLFLDEDNPINIFIKSYGVSIEPNNDYIEKIPQDPKSVLNNPCGAFILDIDEKIKDWKYPYISVTLLVIVSLILPICGGIVGYKMI